MLAPALAARAGPPRHDAARGRRGNRDNNPVGPGQGSRQREGGGPADHKQHAHSQGSRAEMNPPASRTVTLPYRQLVRQLRIAAQAGGLGRFRRRFTGDNRAMPSLGQQVKGLRMACQQPLYRLYRSWRVLPRMVDGSRHDDQPGN